MHYDGYVPSDGGDTADRNPYLVDTEPSPESLLFQTMEEKERKAAIQLLWDALLPQQRELVLKKLKGMTNTEIASSEGVTEAAIRKRLGKIQERFKLFR